MEERYQLIGSLLRRFWDSAGLGADETIVSRPVFKVIRLSYRNSKRCLGFMKASDSVDD